MRYFLFAVWFGITVALCLFSVSDYLFDKRSGLAHLGKRVLLAFIWPLAALSRGGRNLLFKEARNIP